MPYFVRSPLAIVYCANAGAPVDTAMPGGPLNITVPRALASFVGALTEECALFCFSSVPYFVQFSHLQAIAARMPARQSVRSRGFAQRNPHCVLVTILADDRQGYAG